MNYRKIIILPVGFFLLNFIYIGCCKCLEGTFYRDYSSLRVQQLSHSNYYSADTVKVIDTLYSIIQINFDYIAKKEIKNPMSAFVNAAYAFRCNCSNFFDKGYKFAIDSIVIKSDKVFKSIQPGENIGTYFKAVYSNIYNTSPNYLSLDQLKDSLNQNRNYYSLNLFTNPGIMISKIHHLTYSIFVNGKSYSIPGKETIVWQ